MVIQSIDDVIAALANGQKKDFYKSSITGPAAGMIMSLWRATGWPHAGASPGVATGLVPTSNTSGSFPFTTSGQSYIMQMSVNSVGTTKYILYDRLWHNSELSGIITVNTTIGVATPLTRPDGDGVGAELWTEVYTAIGTTASTLTVKYTNSSGVTGRTGLCVRAATSNTVGRMDKVILQTGDVGVKAVESYSWSNTTGTAGNFGFTILRRITWQAVTISGIGANADFVALGIPPIYDGACLALMGVIRQTGTGETQGSFIIGQG